MTLKLKATHFDKGTVLFRDLDHLNPAFAEVAHRAVRRANQAGYPVGIFEAWRSPLRQSWLYAQGRSREGRKVTGADAWESWHQYGLAFDIALDKDPGPARHWYWDNDHEVYEKIAAIMQDEGLEWLGLGDAGHFQLTGKLSVQDAKEITMRFGLQRLWLEVNYLCKIK